MANASIPTISGNATQTNKTFMQLIPPSENMIAGKKGLRKSHGAIEIIKNDGAFPK